MIGFAPKDEQVNLSQEPRKIFMCFVISKLLGVVAAAIQGNVDCEDYISHWIVVTPSYVLALMRVEAWPDAPVAQAGLVSFPSV